MTWCDGFSMLMCGMPTERTESAARGTFELHRFGPNRAQPLLPPPAAPPRFKFQQHPFRRIKHAHASFIDNNNIRQQQETVTVTAPRIRAQVGYQVIPALPPIYIYIIYIIYTYI